MTLLALATEAVPEGPSVVTDGVSWFLENAWIIPLLPALSFVGILFFGKRMPNKGSELGLAAVGLAFVLSVLTGIAWMDHRDNFEAPGDDGHAIVIDGSASDEVVLVTESP